MQSHETNDPEIKKQILKEIEQAQKLTKQFDFEEVRSGEWFIKLLRQVVNSYKKNARAEYFQQKYPGLSPDEIADKLISVTVRYAAIAGAIAGVTISASQLAILSSAGMTAALFVTSIGAEMIYLARLQICLVLDLAVIYDLQLNPNDPEDILMVFGYALGVTPTEFFGKGLHIAASTVTQTTIRTYISKNTLKAIQDFARQLGFKILQREIIKYAVPAVSAAVGSGYNYTTTLSVGRIAKSHFKNRGKVTEGERALEVSMGPDGTQYDVICRDDRITVQPWPFEEAQFTVSVETRQLSQLSFKNDPELLSTLQQTPVNEITWEFQK